MSRPWGKIGAWAAEAEREEEEEKNRAAALASVAPPSSFPSLKESVKQQPHNQKKKRMPLSEFIASGGGGKDSSSSSKGLTPDEMMRLPTGPKERSEDEMQYGRLGGGFGGYGGGGRRDGGQEGAWGGGNRRSYVGGFDEDRRGGGSMMQSGLSEFEPSRADVVDDWGSGKRVFPVGDAGGRSSRYGSLGGGGGGQSRADEVDNWGAGKKPITPASARSTTFGSGFRDSGPDSGRWERGGGSFRENNNGQERTRLVLEPRKEINVNAVSTGNKPSPFGAARPREEVLAEKGLDWKKIDSEIEAKALSRPTSSHSSRPNSAQSSRSENVNLHGGVELAVKPKPRVNPFGDAKPREVLLEQKGKDWRKIDLELERRVNRPETDEESFLKEEINRLKKELEKEPGSLETGSDSPNIQDMINQKEKELELLARELDDKIRFGQKVSERPGSGAGRVAAFSDRPPSRTGSVDELKNTGFIDRPIARGAADVWSRPRDERRSFQAGRERRFLGTRDVDRKRTGDAW